MFDALKKRWASLKQGEPGRRFKDTYDEHHGRNTNPAQKVLILAAGIVVFAAGIFFMPAPGPGILIVIFGAGLIAQESRPAARLLDAAELRIRAVLAWGVGVWSRATLPRQLAYTLLAILLAGAGLFGAYWLLFR